MSSKIVLDNPPTDMGPGVNSLKELSNVVYFDPPQISLDSPFNLLGEAS